MNIDVGWANFWVNVALAIVTFLAVCVALFEKMFWDWWNKPIIIFGLSNSPPHVVQICGVPPTIIKYFRLMVINKGKTVAKNCHIKLVSVVPQGRQLNLPLVEPDKLKWSNAPMDNRYSIRREKIDISHSGGWEFCDLFRIESTFMTEIKFMSFGDRTVSITDEYIIIIEISGDNFKPKRAEIRTSHSQNSFWNTRIEWSKNIFQ